MEKRKLLLVAISVGIFLVIAIGSAIVFAPQQNAGGMATAVAYPAPGITTINMVPTRPVQQMPPADFIQPAPVAPVDLVRGPVDTLGLQTPADGAGRHGGDFIITGDQGVVPQVVINVPRPTAAAVPDAPPPPRVAPPVAQPAPPARTVTPAPVAARPAPAPRPAAPAATRVQNDYWVQTGSFSTIVNAERARDELAHMGITAIIENREVNGRTWFRVRVGPYTSQSEANHWLALIRAMDGFDSEIERYRPTVWQTARL